MDSLTQIALGAAVGEATLGRRVGRRALVWGALCGTLPDLDTLIPFGDPVSDFTYHRGMSHSVLFLTLLTPLLTWLITRIHPGTRGHWRGWLTLVWLTLATHVLLDSFTIYGTQLLLPFDDTPVAWGTIFVIDPLYTLPLLLGVLAAASLRSTSGLGYRLNAAGLVLSTLYLAFSIGAKVQVNDIVASELTRQGLPAERHLAVPTPFNTLLWRIVVMGEGAYYEGVYSLLDASPRIHFTRHAHRPELLRGIAGQWAVRRLKWFTKGFYAVTLQDGAVSVTDLRMGQEPFYVFSFKVGEVQGHRVVATAPQRNVGRRPPPEALHVLWQRIWSADRCPSLDQALVSLRCAGT